MKPDISKDTRLCMSLGARPGNHGTRFHNFLYDELELDFVYKAFSTTDIDAAIGGVRALGIRGCSISMPFKEACLELVDTVDASARAIASVNTIVQTDGHLEAFNTDYVAIRTLLAEHDLPPSTTVAVAGSGGMAKAVVAALHDSGYASCTIVARNHDTGTRLAERYGAQWRPDAEGLTAALVVNATPIGMAGAPTADELAFPAFVVAEAETVFDVVALPIETPLVQLARSRGKAVITGGDVIALQAAEQFHLYTGVRPTPDQVRRATEHARAH